MFAISEHLTPAFDHYLQIVRPRLLNQNPQASGKAHTSEGQFEEASVAAVPAASEVSQTLQHDYVFVKRNGTAPRSDFSACTSLVTQQYIGRAVNAHAFRAAVVTAYYEMGATQSEMDILANIMAHDPATAKSFYYRPKVAAAAIQTNDKVAQLLLSDPVDLSRQTA